jgi:hypothetical protein
MITCAHSGCTLDAGHELQTPHGRLVIDGTPCAYCGNPEPCAVCWQPITIAAFKGICAEAGRDTAITRERE